MKLQEIIEKCSSLKIHTKRYIDDKYVELVFFNEEIDHWRKILEGFLGPATKPAGVEPSTNQKKTADPFGGINTSQTLFQKTSDNIMIIAMFWPWQDGEYVTLKLAMIQSRS